MPTWNYIAAHVYDTTHIMSDEQVLNALKRLANKYEKASIAIANEMNARKK